LPKGEVLQRQRPVRANRGSQGPKEDPKPSDHDWPNSLISPQNARDFATDEFLEGTGTRCAIETYNPNKIRKNDLLVEGKGFVGHVSSNHALLGHTRVQNAAEHGTPRNQAQPRFCRCPAGEALLCGPRRRSPGRGSRPSTPSGLGKGGR